jgi:hypothetical protein
MISTNRTAIPTRVSQRLAAAALMAGIALSGTAGIASALPVEPVAPGPGGGGVVDPGSVSETKVDENLKQKERIRQAQRYLEDFSAAG